MYPRNKLSKSKTPKRITILFIGLFLALSWASPAFSDPGKRANAEALTHSLVGLNSAYQKAAPAAKSAALQKLTDATVERQALLAELVKTDPGAVLRTAIPSRVRKGMPVEVQAFIEQRLEIEGELEVLYEDYADGSHRLRHTLKTNNGERISLHFKSNPHGLLSGTEVNASGVLVDGTGLALESDESILVQACCNASGLDTNATTPVPNTFGEQRTLVLLVNFQDDPTNKPYTIDDAHNLVFGEVNDFYFENSYQQTWLTGDTRGWFTLPMNGVCDLDPVAAEADAAAGDAGIDVSAYDRLVYVFPKIPCGGAAGYGSVGGNPSRAWINDALYLKVVGHELGHNFGLYHSSGRNCQGGVLTEDCVVLGYGDGLDIMGSQPAHVNAYQKERLGWLGFGNSPWISTVDNSGTFTIEPYETVSQAVKALKILQSVNPATGDKTWYYIDYRQPLGFDELPGNAFLDRENVFNGLLFRRLIENATLGTETGSQLLDMTPDSDADVWGDLDDPALVVDASYTDAVAGLTITTIGADTSGATVQVSYGAAPCVPGNPQLAITPAEGDWVSPGTPVAYSVSVTNNDSTVCNASTFDLAASAPAGWSTAFNRSALTLDPGSSVSATMTVSSAPTAVDGFYTIDVSAAARNDGAYAAAVAVTYVVSAAVEPPANNPPVALNDSVMLLSKSAINIAVLANDSDPDGDFLTVGAFSNGSKGSVSYNADGTLTYTPAKRFKSSDSFSYTITDGVDTDSATVSIALQTSSGGGGGGKGKPKK